MRHCAPDVLDVDGRTSEIFRFGDADVHPVVFSTAIGADRGVADYQVRQRGEGVEVDVVPTAELDLDRLVDAVERGLAAAGVEAKACVRTVDEIARHPVTGKATRFIPERPTLHG